MLFGVSNGVGATFFYWFYWAGLEPDPVLNNNEMSMQ